MIKLIEGFLLIFLGVVIGIAISAPPDGIVKLNWTKDPEAVQRQFDLYQEDYDVLRVRGLQQDRYGVCNIWLLEPSDKYDRGQMAILGHEVLHCYWGSYHD